MPLENPNEVITRRREQNLNDQKGNFQIQQNNLLPKKQILIPVTEEKTELKNNVAQLKKDQVIKVKEEHVGYIRLQDITNAPSVDWFEPDSEDLEMLRSAFPKEFKSTVSTDPAVFNLNVSKDFIKAVEYIEQTRDFSFKNLHLVNTKLNAEALQKIGEYWKIKTQRTKYPLMRKFWNINLKKEEFGKLDQLRIAFRDREPDKKKSTRQSRKMTNIELCNQLRNIQDASRIVERILVLILRREKLKLAKSIVMFGNPENWAYVKDDLLKGTEKDLEDGESLYQEYNPLPSPPSSPRMTLETVVPEVVIPRLPKQPENEIAFFVSTLLCELQKFDFDINEIRVDNLAQINSKIRTLKQSQNPLSQTSNQEKTISLTAKPVRAAVPTFDNYVPYKRFGYDCSNDIYIEKVDKNKLRTEISEQGLQNFVPDYLLKRTLSKFCQENGMFKVNAASGFNPDVYCESGNYSTSNVSFENLKNWKYMRLFEELNGTEEVGIETMVPEIEGNEASVLQRAETDVNELNLGSGFKNWMNNKKVKTI